MHMSDKTRGKLATRRHILTGAGVVVAGGLACTSTDDEARGTVPGSAGSGGDAMGGGSGVDGSTGADDAGSREAGGGNDDASGEGGANSPGGDAFADAGMAAVIDCHTHFFDTTRAIPTARVRPVPWPDPGSVLYRRTLPADYLQLALPLGITGTVVIEASAWMEDNQWMIDLAATHPAIVGFVGNFSEATTPSLFEAALQRYERVKLFRGIRVGPGDLTVANQSNFEALATSGLMIDVLCSPADLMAVAAFARRVPKLRIVVDHVGGVSIDGKAPPAAWVSGMQAAAALPSVYCKVSNLVEATGATKADAPSDVAFYRPVLDTLWAAFGADRLVFGSNWPVSGPAAPLFTVVSIVKTYFTEKGSDELDKYFYRNGKAAYGF